MTKSNILDNQLVIWLQDWAKESGSFMAGKSEFHGRKVRVSWQESQSFMAGKSEKQGLGLRQGAKIMKNVKKNLYYNRDMWWQRRHRKR